VPVLRILALALAVVAGTALGAPVHAAAQPAPPNGSDDPVLAALIEEALERNPDVKGAQEALAAARSRPVQARSLSNPMVAVGYTNDGWAPTLGSMPMTTLAVMATQDLPYPGKRRLRGEIASLQADQVEEQLARVALGTVARVRRAYSSLLLARDLLELIREQEEIWKQIEGVARARYAVGQGAQQDVLRVQIEVTRIGQLRAEQDAVLETARAELNRLLDRPAEAPLDATAPLGLAKQEGSLDEILARLEVISPELQFALISVERDRLAADLARKEFKPDFTVQGGYMNRGGLDPMWQAGVGVSLPLYRKQISAGVAEAAAQTRASERLVESTRLQLRFRTQERMAQLRAAERIAEVYDQGVIPQDRMSVEAAVANYQTGKVPFVAVLEALTTLYNDRATHLGVLADHGRIRASLEEASLEATSGMSPSGASGMRAVGGRSLGMSGGFAPGGSGSTGASGMNR